MMIDSARANQEAFFGTAYRWVIGAVVVILGGVAAALLAFKLHRQPLFIDYLTMWTGGRIADVDPRGLYDFALIDHAQAWLLGARAHDRPFPYPPSALLAFAPLARLPFWISAAVWSLGGVGAYGVSSWRLAPRRRLAIAAAIGVLPGVVWAALSGQCAFLVGALAIAAFAALDRRPAFAGLALGLALALKPTVLLMAPFSLLGGGRWRALAATCLAGAAAIGLSILLFGLQPWIDWLTVAPGYLAKISEDPRYATGIMSPAALAGRLGMQGAPSMVWKLSCLVAGGALAAVGFRLARRSTVQRLNAVIAGSLLASPYAMNYETALLAPGVAIMLVTATGLRPRAIALGAYVALALAGLPNIGVYAFLVFVGFVCLQLGGADGAGSGDELKPSTEPGGRRSR